MSQSGEYRVADTTGRFTQVVRDGRRLNDVGWIPGRILLSNRRLVLAGNAGKRTIPLSKVTELGGRHDVNQLVAKVAGYVSIRFDNDVVLVAAEDPESFEIDCYRAFLDQRTALVRHPAVEGGVVQDTSWERARMKVDDEGLNVALESGAFVRIELDDISAVEAGERTVQEERTRVVEVEHTDEATSVQTHLTAPENRGPILESFLRKGAELSESAVDLGATETEVLMALYSGVSPFEIPEFLNKEVDDVEAIFEELLELDVLEEVRVRREVTLTARGRNIASQAMNEQ